jgi:ribosomal protein L11
MEPGREVTGYLTRKHIYEIAKIKSQVIHLNISVSEKRVLSIDRLSDRFLKEK